ncbi:MAG: hypothetical protein ACI8W8_003716 [Rhodothermales bacterium]|jgi:hypothetical protein
MRHLLFFSICIAGFGAILGNLLQGDPFRAPLSFQSEAARTPAFRDAGAAIDGEFAESWQSAGLEPAELADDLTLIRRLSLALTGTIPSFEEIRAFEAQPEGERIHWWLSYLFEDRRYSDYFAERLARAYVGVDNGPFLVYRRRRFVTWLSEQLQANIAYDQLVQRLITAKGIWTTNPEVNFFTATIDQNNKTGPNEIKLAARTTRAFLGVRIDCVQCHDDFMGDRWKQKDFHGLAAFYAPASMGNTGLHDTETPYEYQFRPGRDPEVVPPKAPFETSLRPDSGILREQLADWVTHKENDAFARAICNRIWALMFGVPLMDPVDSIPLDGPYAPGLELLADDFVAHGYDLQRLIRVIANTRPFRSGSESISQQHEDAWAAFPHTRLRPEQVAGSVIQAASLSTIDAESHILVRLGRFGSQNDFIKRYGDAGEDEFDASGGTIPQRLLMMNGELVHKKTKEDLVTNAGTQILAAAPSDAAVVETTYLSLLTRRPSEAERDHFETRLAEAEKRGNAMQDLYWALINATEFSWNH